MYFTSYYASAQDVRAWPCNGCSDAQMESLAIQKGIGFRHVYNLNRGIIVNYLVERLDIPQGPMQATPFLTEDWITDQYIGIHDFYVDNGNGLHGVTAKSAQSESDGSVNGYDVVGSGVDRNRVSDAIANDPRFIFTSIMASFGRAIRLAGIVTPDVALSVTVNFPDGSNAVYQFNWDTKKWGYAEGTARDSNNNSIPESRDDFVNGGVGTGEFDFTGGNTNDFDDFLRRASSYGITVTGGRGRIACVQVGTGQIHCSAM